MSLIPPDTSIYFGTADSGQLFQGDIVSGREIGMDWENAPEYWLIITKSCDLVFRGDQKKVKNDVCALLGVYTLQKQLNLIKRKYFVKPKNGFLGRVVLAGILRFSESTSAITNTNHIDNLVEDKITKFMLLPPDGTVFTEPMIVDFDLIHPLSGEEIEAVLMAKKLQLSSPFRERLSQRFAAHFFSIGIDDNEVKSPSYREKLKKHFTDSKQKEIK